MPSRTILSNISFVTLSSFKTTEGPLGVGVIEISGGCGSVVTGISVTVRGISAVVTGALVTTGFLVTAGPTVEKIDPVRYISNHSTGKMGYAIAAELAARGASVTLVSGPVELPTPDGVSRIDVVSAEDMFLTVSELWPSMDGAVMCAAVADYTPANPSPTKIKKGVDAEKGGDILGEKAGAKGAGANFAADPSAPDDCLTIKLRPTRDIAAHLGSTKRDDQILVGFALETDNEETNALSKMERKNLDIIVLNSLRDPGAGFGGDTNKITIFSRNGEKCALPLLPKTEVAAHIVDRIAATQNG